MQRLNVTCVALSLCLATGQAHAADANCDFYQNAVIGTRCAATVSLGASFNYNELKEKYSFSAPSFNYEQQNTHDSSVGSLSFGWTPTKWFSLTYSSGYDWIRGAIAAQQNWNNFFGSGSASRSNSASSSRTGNQTLVANVNLYDSGAGSQRFVLNGYIGGSYLPSETITVSHGGGTFTEASDTIAYGGFTAFGTGRINQDFSVTPVS